MDQQTRVASVPICRAVLVGAGSVTVGVHAGLAPDHLRECAPLGAAFIAAATVSALAVMAVLLRPAARWPAPALLVVLAGLASAYVLTRLVALPPLDPDREQPDTTGIVTVAVELVGVLAGLRLAAGTSHRRRTRLVLDQGGSR